MCEIQQQQKASAPMNFLILLVSEYLFLEISKYVGMNVT